MKKTETFQSRQKKDAGNKLEDFWLILMALLALVGVAIIIWAGSSWGGENVTTSHPLQTTTHADFNSRNSHE